MRLRGALVMGALMLGAMACGESVGLQTREGKDLEFVMPAMRGELPRASTYRTWDEPTSELDFAKIQGMPQASIASTGEPAMLPWILSTSASGTFRDWELRIQYGFKGAGTGYSMKPALKVYGADGTLIFNETGNGRAEDAPIYWYMHPSAEETFVIPSNCGAVALLKVKFEVHVALPVFTGSPLGRTEANEDQLINQAECAPPPSLPSDGGGSTPIAVNSGLYICYYEVWVDGRGNIVDVFFIGCTEVGTEILAV